MSEELIDEYIDQPAFKAQTDFAVNEVNRLLSSFDSLKKAKADIASSKGLVDISAAVRQSEKDTQLLLKTQILLANQKKAEIQLDNELLKNAKLKEQAADRLIKKEQDLAAAKAKNTSPEFQVKTGGENDAENIKKTGAVVNQLDKDQAEAAISAREFGNANKTATKVIQDETKSTHELNKEMELKKQLDRQAAQELKNTVREENAVKGSLEQRRAALIRLNAVYDNQSPQERASASGQRLQKIIGGLDTQVKTLESSTGRAQRNVGNYGSAFDKISGGVSKAFGAIRTLANILPGVGLSGIFLGAFEIIQQVATATAFLGEKQTLLNNVYKEAAKNSSSQVSVLTLLQTKLNDLNVSQADRVKFVKEYNKIADDGNKIDETQINNLDLINKKIEAQIALIVKRAVAKAAESKLDEQAAKVVDAQLEVSQFEKFKDARKLNAEELKALNAEDKKEQVQNASQNQKTNSDALVQQSRFFKARAALNSDALEGQKKYNKAKLILDKEQAELDRQAGLLSPLITADGISTSDSKAKKAASDNLQALKELLDNQFKEYEIAQKRKISNFERDLNDDKIHYSEKLDILQKYYDANIELIDRQDKEERRLAIDKAARETQKLQEEKGGKSFAEKARINANIKITEENLAKELLLLTKQTEDKKTQVSQNTLDKIYDQSSKNFEKIKSLQKDDLRQFKEYQEQKLKIAKDIVENSTNKEELELRAQFEIAAAGKSTAKRKELEEKLQVSIVLLREKAALKALILDNNELLRKKALLQLLGFNTADIEKQITQNLIEQAKLRGQIYNDENKKRKIGLDEILQIEQEAASVLSAIIDGQATKKKNKIQVEIDDIDKRKEADLKANDARVQSDQDRAANALLIQARADAQKEILDRKKREIDYKQAQTEKAIAIFQIILGTAVAIAKAQNPLSKVLAAVSGAAQLAVAIATPVPRLFKGKKKGESVGDAAMLNDHPDGRTMEVIERADGSIEFPEGRNSIHQVGVNDIVHPDRDAFVNAAIAAAFRDSNAGMHVQKGPQKEDKVHSALMLQTKLLKQIANKPSSTTHATDRGLTQVMHWGATQIKYVNENTNW